MQEAVVALAKQLRSGDIERTAATSVLATGIAAGTGLPSEEQVALVELLVSFARTDPHLRDLSAELVPSLK